MDQTPAKYQKTTRRTFSRRDYLLAGSLITFAIMLKSCKTDNSGPRGAYFLGVQKALIAAGISQPILIIDRSRFLQNIKTMLGHFPSGMNYRIVAKSLPTLDCLYEIQKATRTNRLMTFNLPMLNALSDRFPKADQLLGKPLPVLAAKNFLEGNFGMNHKDVQWLIDSPKRLAQYEKLGRSKNLKLRVNIELDVGLHRGGVVADKVLSEMLATISKSDSLQFSGFMGYEPHIASLPNFGGMKKKAINTAWKTYADAKSAAFEILGEAAMDNATFNAAGSPTYKYYKDTKIANELAVGSALVKPSDFDKDILSDHLNACFIATPVIKAANQTQTPGLEGLDGIKRRFNPNLDKSIFIHGGHWMADPVDPPGLQFNKLFGRSSNQELLNGGPKTDLNSDDFIFFRPHQSEAVFMRFGDIAVYENGAIVDYWPVLPASA